MVDLHVIRWNVKWKYKKLKRKKDVVKTRKGCQWGSCRQICWLNNTGRQQNRLKKRSKNRENVLFKTQWNKQSLPVTVIIIGQSLHSISFHFPIHCVSCAKGKVVQESRKKEKKKKKTTGSRKLIPFLFPGKEPAAVKVNNKAVWVSYGSPYSSHCWEEELVWRNPQVTATGVYFCSHTKQLEEETLWCLLLCPLLAVIPTFY